MSPPADAGEPGPASDSQQGFSPPRAVADRDTHGITGAPAEKATAPMALGGGYWGWLAGAVCSELGSNVMAFAIVWTATGFGGTTAGVVATSTMLFRALLLLGGGSLGDRFGPRRIMIVCDSSMLFVTSFAAVWFWLRGPSIISLVLLGCLLGIVSAFYIPASGVSPLVRQR